MQHNIRYAVSRHLGWHGMACSATSAFSLRREILFKPIWRFFRSELRSFSGRSFISVCSERRRSRRRRYGFDSKLIYYTLRYFVYNLRRNISNSCGYPALLACWMEAIWARNNFWGYVSLEVHQRVWRVWRCCLFSLFFFITRECYIYSRPCRDRCGGMCRSFYVVNKSVPNLCDLWWWWMGCCSIWSSSWLLVIYRENLNLLDNRQRSNNICENLLKTDSFS